MMRKEILDEKELAARWKVSVRTLQHWRQYGTGPVWTVIGKNTVRYRIEDIKAHEVANKITPTTKEENHVE